MNTYLMILFSMILVNNIVLAKFLGICSFLGLTKDLKNSMGMSMAVIFVMLVATGLTYPIHHGLLTRWNLEYLDTVVFILVIASAVQVIEAIMRKAMPALYQALGIYLPLITTNCAILGIMISNISEDYGFLQAMVASLGAGLGYTLAMFLFAGVVNKLKAANPPKFMEGMPLTLMSSGIVSVAFFGFKGIIESLFG